MKNGTRVRLLRPSYKLRLVTDMGTVRDIVDLEYRSYRIALDVPASWVWPNGHVSHGETEVFELAENLEIIAT